MPLHSSSRGGVWGGGGGCFPGFGGGGRGKRREGNEGIHTQCALSFYNKNVNAWKGKTKKEMEKYQETSIAISKQFASKESES